jgi:uncharacterized repeat protein (TIGR01451 family)
VALNVPLPATTTFQSLSAPAGWSCTTPAVSATGTVNCTNPSLGLTTAAFTLVVHVNSTAIPGTVVSTTATVTSATADPTPANNSATANTTVISPSNVSGTKSVAGQLYPGGTVTYTIVLTNAGPAAQADNPGNEFLDVLPASLHLVTANATSGTTLATVGTNTVTWNGAIPAGGSVTISILATVDSAAVVGSTITNQGTISYDADGNGTNESTRTTDDAAAAGSNNPTSFAVGAPATAGPADIPALDGLGLFALAALLALVGVAITRRT